MDPDEPLFLDDPVLRRLAPFWIPQAFQRLPADERRWRGRVFLIAVTITGGESGGAVMLAWNVAMTRDAEAAADNRHLVEATPDEAILAGLAAMRER